MDEKYSKLSPDCPIRIEKQNPKLSLSTDTPNGIVLNNLHLVFIFIQTIHTATIAPLKNENELNFQIENQKYRVDKFNSNQQLKISILILFSN